MGAPQLQGQLVQRGKHNFLLAAVPFGLGNIGELHIAMEGEWRGHPQGEFRFTSDVFDQMVAKFEAQKNPIPIDYEHKSFDDRDPDTRAAGWIQKLEKRRGEQGYELWAIVEWTDPAAQMIRGGEYKFCSPAFALTDTDRVTNEQTGPVLKNVALTNLPFLDGQAPIRLSFVCAVSAADPAQPPQMQPPGPMPEQEQQAQMQAMSEQLTAFVDAVAKTANVDRAAVVAALNEMTDDIAGQVREHLDADGMPQEEPMTEKMQAPAAAEKDRADEIEAKAKQNEQTIALSQIPAIRAELDELKKEREAEKAAAKARAEAEAKAKVDGMVACGALLDTEHDDALWLLSADPTRFERVYGGRMKNKAVPIGESQAGNEPLVDPDKATAADLTEAERSTFEWLCRNWKPERALKAVLRDRVKRQTATRGASKVG